MTCSSFQTAVQPFLRSISEAFRKPESIVCRIDFDTVDGNCWRRLMSHPLDFVTITDAKTIEKGLFKLLGVEPLRP
jgi:hypothetical protein